MIKRYGGLLLFILFPVIGFMGMVLILSGGQNQNRNETFRSTPRTYPTPLPILTTAVPTVTIIPILDNPIPQAMLVTLDGQDVNTADFTGQITILNFWATWCPPCVEEMPFLRDYAAEHEGVRIIAVTSPGIDQSVEQIQGFIETYDLGDLTILFDENSYLQFTMGAMQLPTTFIIDAEGVVRFRQIGPVDAEMLDFYLSELN